MEAGPPGIPRPGHLLQQLRNIPRVRVLHRGSLSADSHLADRSRLRQDDPSPRKYHAAGGQNV